MKRFISSAIGLMMLALAPAAAETQPYDFSTKLEGGQTIYLKVTDAGAKTVAVCNQTGNRHYSGNTQNAYESASLKPTGALVIPQKVTDNGTTYTVTAIDTMAFCGCGSLTSVTLPETIKNIRAAAFMETYLTTGATIDIPASVERIEEWAFRGANIASVTGCEGVQFLGEYAFLYCSITEISLPAIVELDGYALQTTSSGSLKKVELGANLTTIGYAAFYNQTNLETFICNATSVPSGPSNWYGNSKPANATLWVPKSADQTVLNAYKTNANWTFFAAYQEIGDVVKEYCYIEVSTTGSGTVSIDGATAASGSKRAVEKGTSASISFEPAAGYEIGSVTLGGEDITEKLSGTGYTISSLDADTQLSVSFVKSVYTVRVAVEGSGAVLDHKFYYGEVFRLAISADDGVTIDGVTVDGNAHSTSLNFSVYKSHDVVISLTKSGGTKSAAVTAESNVRCWSADGNVVVSCPDGISSISLIDLGGRTVSTAAQHGTIGTIALPQGMRAGIVRISKADGSICTVKRRF